MAAWFQQPKCRAAPVWDLSDIGCGLGGSLRRKYPSKYGVLHSCSSAVLFDARAQPLQLILSPPVAVTSGILVPLSGRGNKKGDEFM